MPKSQQRVRSVVRKPKIINSGKVNNNGLVIPVQLIQAVSAVFERPLYPGELTDLANTAVNVEANTKVRQLLLNRGISYSELHSTLCRLKLRFASPLEAVLYVQKHPHRLLFDSSIIIFRNSKGRLRELFMRRFVPERQIKEAKCYR